MLHSNSLEQITQSFSAAIKERNEHKFYSTFRTLFTACNHEQIIALFVWIIGAPAGSSWSATDATGRSGSTESIDPLFFDAVLEAAARVGTVAFKSS
jgi:hypothetical protein